MRFNGLKSQLVPPKPSKDRRKITEEDIISWGKRNAHILLNGVRLLDDARVLRTERRYASATALAVLSLEETGKFALLHEDFHSWVTPISVRKRGASFTHKQKQNAAAQMVKLVLAFDDIETLTRLAGFRTTFLPLDSNLDSVFPSEDVLISSISEKRLFQNAEDNGLRDYLVFFALLMKGAYDDIKQKCFYIDVADDESKESTPTSIDRRICDGAMKLASKAIWASKLHLRRFAKFRGISRID
jgi:AbiV family abortive infection protein